MTFTYNLDASGTVLTVSQMRLEIGDTVQNSGVLPSGANYTDEELLHFFGQESSMLGGAAHACEALSRTWGRLVDTTAGPLRKDYSQAARAWAKQASDLRAQTGGGYAVTSNRLKRQDGYAYRAGSVESAP